jgi:hypothetical protein
VLPDKFCGLPASEFTVMLSVIGAPFPHELMAETLNTPLVAVLLKLIVAELPFWLIVAPVPL